MNVVTAAENVLLSWELGISGPQIVNSFLLGIFLSVPWHERHLQLETSRGSEGVPHAKVLQYDGQG